MAFGRASGARVGCANIGVDGGQRPRLRLGIGGTLSSKRHGGHEKEVRLAILDSATFALRHGLIELLEQLARGHIGRRPTPAPVYQQLAHVLEQLEASGTT